MGEIANLTVRSDGANLNGVRDQKWKDNDLTYLSALQSEVAADGQNWWFTPKSEEIEKKPEQKDRPGSRESAGSLSASDDGADGQAAAMHPHIDLGQLRQLRKIFENTDTDGSGVLDEDEFVTGFGPILSKTMTPEDLRHLFLRIDANANGVVDWDEFSAYVLLSSERSLQEHAADATYVRHGDVCGDADKSRGSEKRAGGDRATLSTCILCNSRNGKYYTCGRDGAVKVWNGQTLAFEGALHRGRSWITDAVLTKGDSRLHTCSMDKVVSIFEVGVNGTGELWRSFRGMRKAEAGGAAMIRSEADRNGGIPRPSNRDTLMERMRKGNPVRKAMLEMATLNALNECPMSITQWGQYMCLGLRSGHVQLYDPSSSVEEYARVVPCAASYQLHKSPVSRMCTAKYVDGIITAGWDREIKIVSLERGKVTRTLGENGLHQKSIFALEWSESHRLLASAGTERHVLIWNPYIAKPMHRLDGHQRQLVSVCFNESQHQLISLSVDKAVKVWDLRTLKCLQTLCEEDTHQPEDTLSCLAYDSRRGAIVCASSRPAVFPVRSMLSSFPTEPVYRGHHAPVICAVFNREFNQVLSADANGRVIVWDATRGERLSSFDVAPPTGPTTTGNEEVVQPQAGICTLDLDQNGRRLLIATHSFVRVFNFASGQALREFGLKLRDGCPVPGSTNKGSRCKEIVGAVFVYDSEKGSTHVVAALGSTVVVWVDTQADGSAFGQEPITKWRTLTPPGHGRGSKAPSPTNRAAESERDKVSVTCLCAVPPHHVALGTDRAIVALYSHNANEVEGWLGRTRPGIAVETVRSVPKQELVVAVVESEVTGWLLRHKSVAWTLHSHNMRPVPAVNVGPDGVIVTGDDSGMVHVWDAWEAPQKRQCQLRVMQGGPRELDRQSTEGGPGLAIRVPSSHPTFGSEPLATPSSQPNARRSYLAHLQTISALDLVLTDTASESFVLTASSDCQLRLFTLAGDYVGYFGQQFSWRLPDRSTWACVRAPDAPAWARQPAQDLSVFGGEPRAQTPGTPTDQAKNFGWEEWISSQVSAANNAAEQKSMTPPLSPRCPAPKAVPVARPVSPTTAAGIALRPTAISPPPAPTHNAPQRPRSVSPLAPRAPPPRPQRMHPRRLRHGRILSASRNRKSGPAQPEPPEVPHPPAAGSEGTPAFGRRSSGPVRPERPAAAGGPRDSLGADDELVQARMARRELLLRSYKGQSPGSPMTTNVSSLPLVFAPPPSNSQAEASRVIERLKNQSSVADCWTARPTLKLHCREPAPVPQPRLRQLDGSPTSVAHLRAVGRVAAMASGSRL